MSAEYKFIVVMNQVYVFVKNHGDRLTNELSSYALLSEMSYELLLFCSGHVYSV